MLGDSVCPPAVPAAHGGEVVGDQVGAFLDGVEVLTDGGRAGRRAEVVGGVLLGGCPGQGHRVDEPLGRIHD